MGLQAHSDAMLRERMKKYQGLAKNKTNHLELQAQQNTTPLQQNTMPLQQNAAQNSTRLLQQTTAQNSTDSLRRWSFFLQLLSLATTIGLIYNAKRAHRAMLANPPRPGATNTPGAAQKVSLFNLF